MAAPGPRHHADLPPRLLVRTYRQAPQDWDPQLSGIAPEVLARLADLGLRLIGIDTASIDPADSHALHSHQVARTRQLRVLENLVLDAVPEGDYELIALPLKLMEAEASPVRAVLRTLGTQSGLSAELDQRRQLSKTMQQRIAILDFETTGIAAPPTARARPRSASSWWRAGASSTVSRA